MQVQYIAKCCREVGSIHLHSAGYFVFDIVLLHRIENIKVINLTIHILVSVQISPFFFFTPGPEQKVSSHCFFKTVSNRNGPWCKANHASKRKAGLLPVFSQLVVGGDFTKFL